MHGTVRLRNNRADAGLCDTALQSLAEAGVSVTVFDAVEADALAIYKAAW